MAAFMSILAKDSPVSFAGESISKGFVGWIELNSFKVGYLANLEGVDMRRAGRTRYDHFQVTKTADRSTPALCGDPIRNTTFEMVKVSLTTSAEDTTPYLEYEFYDARISRFLVEANHQLRAMETISFGYSGILTRYNIIDKQGVVTGTIETQDVFNLDKDK